MHLPLVVDLHLDLAWDALFWNRDLTLTAHQVREQEDHETPQVAADYNTGSCTVTFPELRRGHVGIMLSTIMSRVETRDRLPRRDGMRTQEQAMAIGRGHLAYYQAMTQRGEIKPLCDVHDLDAAVEAWQMPTNRTPVYHVLSMESADPIANPDDVAFWWDAGLRIVGPAHFGDNTYIHGTGTEGGLKPPARPLFRALRQAGMILDITHMADQAVWESLEIWDGPVMASHCVCRSDWETRHEKPSIGTFGMDGQIPHLEHIADLAGGSLANVAIGTDLDGGFGAELAPTDLDTIADLQRFGQILTRAGYRGEDIDGILHGNALRFLKAAWA